MSTPREKSPLLEAQRRVEPATLHHARQRAQHTIDWAIPAPHIHSLASHINVHRCYSVIMMQEDGEQMRATDLCIVLTRNLTALQIIVKHQLPHSCNLLLLLYLSYTEQKNRCLVWYNYYRRIQKSGHVCTLKHLHTDVYWHTHVHMSACVCARGIQSTTVCRNKRNELFKHCTDVIANKQNIEQACGWLASEFCTCNKRISDTRISVHTMWTDTCNASMHTHTHTHTHSNDILHWPRTNWTIQGHEQLRPPHQLSWDHFQLVQC